MPLVSSEKIAKGMSLMVDIGGGTTDISFFTIKDNHPQVYDFYSIDKGLNFLTESDLHHYDQRANSNVNDASEINSERTQSYTNDVNNVCNNLIIRLQREFNQQTNLSMERLMNALKTRPIIYTGGGSTFSMLRRGYEGFIDIIHISDEQWKKENVEDLMRIKNFGLCPILSTAYGLSISVPDDDINCESFQDLFDNVRGAEEEYNVTRNYVYGRSISSDGFDYASDYDAYK